MASRNRLLFAACLLASTGCAHVQSLFESRARNTPPPSFVGSTAEARTTRIVEVREGLSHAALFHAASEALVDTWTIDVSDSRAGFLMTTWQAGFARSGIPDLRYRTRIVVRFLPPDWRRATVTAEANWQHGDEWVVGFDRDLLAAAATELESHIGRKP